MKKPGSLIQSQSTHLGEAIPRWWLISSMFFWLVVLKRSEVFSSSCDTTKLSSLSEWSSSLNPKGYPSGMKPQEISRSEFFEVYSSVEPCIYWLKWVPHFFFLWAIFHVEMEIENCLYIPWLHHICLLLLAQDFDPSRWCCRLNVSL